MTLKAPTYDRRTAPDGTEYVAVVYEVVVQLGMLKANLAKFRAEEAAWRQKAEETEALIVEVEKIAPDLLLKATQEAQAAQEAQKV